jgi:hypothetical protein
MTLNDKPNGQVSRILKNPRPIFKMAPKFKMNAKRFFYRLKLVKLIIFKIYSKLFKFG